MLILRGQNADFFKNIKLGGTLHYHYALRSFFYCISHTDAICPKTFSNRVDSHY